MPVFDTPRLLVVPLSLETAEALIHGHRPDGERWAPDYPTDSTLVGASMILAAEAEGRPLGLWTGYQIVRRDNGRVIGGCGFVHGGPDSRGRVEVSFSIVDSEHGQGFGEEALRALIGWAKQRPGVTRVTAETARTNVQRIATFEAAGMRRAGCDGDIVSFEA